MKIAIIAALGKNRELGLGNKLPWSLPDDLKRFREITRGHAIIMGRKTYESIGRPLPERKNIIITRNLDYAIPGCIVVHTFQEALDAAGGDIVFVIGGAEIYTLALPRADMMYLTTVDATPDADAYFPEFNENNWKITKTEAHEIDEKHQYKFTFKVYEKKS